MTFEKIPYKKPLVIGMGGGNDIVSATLVLSDLINSGKKPDLAGICSPGAWHVYDRKEEKPVNILTSQTKRYRPSKNPVDLSFIDAKLPEFLKEQDISSKVYNLSLRYGTSSLISGLQELIKEREYDGLIAVDIGGDVLARGPKDPTILSPLMDFTIMYVLSQIETPSTLVVFGLQTDGELRPKGCEEILQELKNSGLLKDTVTIKDSDKAIKTFEKVYRKIENIRHGHTAEMTFKTLKATADIHADYKRTIRILDRKWHQDFPITLEAKYFGKAFVIDLKGLAKTRELAFSYKTPLELYIKTKKIVDTKTEMDMMYEWANETCLWLGLLCPQIQDSERKEILKYGIDNIDVHADVALLWKKDDINIEGMFKETLDDFVLIGESPEKVEQVNKEIRKILGRENDKH
ncbi:MAG: DUF1152 domain-containing protein [Nanoarchaeota archaeon]|nr:DUF1152 domain-containing protein [Nanoarchaeota archaeon]